MTQNEQNFINKINEQADIIEWQKKAIAERDKQLKALQEPKTCSGCTWYGYDFSDSDGDECFDCSRNWNNQHEDHYQPKQK